jgi:hypothetical protein
MLEIEQEAADKKRRMNYSSDLTRAARRVAHQRVQQKDFEVMATKKEEFDREIYAVHSKLKENQDKAELLEYKSKNRIAHQRVKQEKLREMEALQTQMDQSERKQWYEALVDSESTIKERMK